MKYGEATGDMTEEKAYYSAGHLIIEKCNREEWMDGTILPTKVVSASSCICDSHPRAWSLFGSWSPADSGEWKYTIARWPRGKKSPGRDEIIAYAKDKLNLNRKSFSTLGKWVKRAYETEHIEYPNIFVDLSTAREFHRTYLRHIPDLELIGLAFSKESIHEARKNEKHDQMLQDARKRLLSENPDARAFNEEILEEYMQDEDSFEMVEGSFLRVLSRFEPIDSSGIALGFEILGDEGCFNFHSHICNSLETELREELGVTFNENGLIDSYEDAAKSARHIVEGEIGEPVDWYPCLIVRYEFH